MTFCEQFRDRMSAYSDGELSPEQAALIDQHVRTCGSCGAAFEELRRIGNVLQALEVPPVPAGMAGRVTALAMARFANRLKQTAGNPLEWWRSVSRPMRAAVAAMLLCGLATGLVVGWHSSSAPYTGNAVRTQEDLLGLYNLDVLGDVPRGSLADAYLTLSVMDRGEQ